MVSWQPTSKLKRPQSVYTGFTDEPFDMYADRYLEPPSDFRKRDAARYVEETLDGLEGSLLVIGSGHSDHCNAFSNLCPKLEITASDVVDEAMTGLVESVRYVSLDVLAPVLSTDTFDYVFSTHVLEHFTKDQLLDTVWPLLLRTANKAIITIVPYGTAWSDEPSHKCKFYEDDEFASMQDKYKIMFNGLEIAFWKTINENS